MCPYYDERAFQALLSTTGIKHGSGRFAIYAIEKANDEP